MSIFITVFCFELVLFAFSVHQTVAKPGNNVVNLSTTTRDCRNNLQFYAGPSKKVEAMLTEMKKQLTQIQSDIDTMKGANKTVAIGKPTVIDNQLSSKMCWTIRGVFCHLVVIYSLK